jgi:hypothetical protein
MNANVPTELFSFIPCPDHHQLDCKGMVRYLRKGDHNLFRYLWPHTSH